MPVVPFNQHESAFYALAKAAGHDEKNSTLPVGEYTEEAKIAIQKMLGIYRAPWELIEEITLEEESGLDKTVEPDGTPYNFSEVFIRVFYKANLASMSAGYGRYRAYDENDIYVNAETGRYTSNTAPAYKFVYMQRNANMIMVFHSGLTSTGSRATVGLKDYSSSGFRLNFGNIKRIALHGEDKEPAGTLIQIYARRA